MILKKNRTLWALLTVIFVGSGCAEDREQIAYVKIAPAIRTRVAGLHFEQNDCIGLSITKGSEPYVQNKMMSFDGAAFTAPDFVWYNNINEASTLTAYHPYSDLGIPNEFTIASDQRGGCVSSDLLAAYKTGVMPGTEPVGMLFYHVLSQLSILITNNSTATITGVFVGGFKPTAAVDFTALTALAKSGIAASEVQAFCATSDALYRAILVPQQADLSLRITTSDGKIHTKQLVGVTLGSGLRYDLSVKVTNIDITLKLSGEINDWVDGGALGDEDSPSEGTIEYQGAVYQTKQVAGRLWMAENLRYVPSGVTVGNGVWYPASGPDAVSSEGMLYDYRTATAGAASRAGELQGICPPGWHIPSEVELTSLASIPDFFKPTGYWIVSTNGSKYGPSMKGYLMGAALTEQKWPCLLFAEGASAALTPISVDYGVSLRCVKN